MNKRLKIHAAGIISLIIAGISIMEKPDVSIAAASFVTMYKPVSVRHKMRKINKYITGRINESLIIKESLTLLYDDIKQISF
jgi:hypothetical protein